jgi:hypothetical protein
VHLPDVNGNPVFGDIEPLDVMANNSVRHIGVLFLPGVNGVGIDFGQQFGMLFHDITFIHDPISSTVARISFSPVPEPKSVLLLGSFVGALAAMCLVRGRRSTI